MNIDLINGRLVKAISWWVILLGGIALSGIIFFNIHRFETKFVSDQFSMIAHDRAEVIVFGMVRNLELLQSIRQLYVSSQSVEREEFAAFTKDIFVDHPEILEFRWLQRVGTNQRQAFEESADAAGLRNFYIKDIDDDGDITKAAVREEYFPILYIEPRNADNEELLGVDAASVPERLQGIKKARDTGSFVMIPEIKHFKNPDVDTATRVFLPVYSNHSSQDTLEDRRMNLKGLLVMIFHIDSASEILLKDFRGEGIDSYIYDESLPKGKKLIGFDHLQVHRNNTKPFFGEEQLEQLNGIAWRGQFKVADLTLTIICRPAPEFFKSYGYFGSHRNSWFIFGVCIMFTLMGAASWRSLKYRSQIVETLVEKKARRSSTVRNISVR